MTGLIFGGLFAFFTLIMIGLVRTFAQLPVKELKRRARQGDPLASALYRAASYGVSLQVLLWALVAISAALSFVLLSVSLEPWFAFFVIAFLIWLGFLWIPAGDLTGMGETIARKLSPVLAWLLNYLHPLLERIGNFLFRHRHFQVRTQLYEKDDLVELLEKQKGEPDNRIAAADIAVVQHALTFGDKRVSDVHVPQRVVVRVSVDEPIGPKLMDDLYQSGYSRFPVYEGDITTIVGTLYLKDLVGRDRKGRVRDVMRSQVYYVHEDFTLQEALQAFLKTKHHLFIVVNSFEEFVGILTIEDILEQIIGKQIIDEFDTYDDMRAVAAKAANHDHKERKKAKQAIEPAPETKQPKVTGEDVVSDETGEKNTQK